MDRAEVDAKIRELAEPFNKKGIEIKEDTTFQNDLEFDSLTVMDFVAEIEDEFDIIISMNQQAEIETYGQLVDAVVFRMPAVPSHSGVLHLVGLQQLVETSPEIFVLDWHQPLAFTAFPTVGFPLG